MTKKGGVIELPLMCSEADVKRLRAAGWAPVVRWVDAANKSDTPLKTVEVLTHLDRIHDKTKTKQGEDA